ncbi:uncharacterized protein LOC125828921 [Solanum verrucosum]|uniref:uncharacterized protein LOC125828921 n=1 Tax=Solanum verrucosum TaxID=315347 RepID=UPI0020D0FEC5|nr:uncharacterized protein LOC125828921 [Solanum verrucosum]
MANKFCFEALDRTLRDILRVKYENSSDKPFGGLTIIFGSDFRQILPVIPKGTRVDILDASLNSSYLWPFFTIYELKQNMQLCCGRVSDSEAVEITTFDKCSAKAKITLWEELGEKFSPYLYNNDAGPYIVIVTSTTVKEFYGEVSFSTTYASKIYVNLDIDYIRSLAPKFSTMSTELQVIESSNVNSLPIEEEMFMNRMDIKELLEAEWSSELQDRYAISWYLFKTVGIHCYREEQDKGNR